MQYAFPAYLLVNKILIPGLAYASMSDPFVESLELPNSKLGEGKESSRPGTEQRRNYT
jgi:hypothetical protein